MSASATTGGGARCARPTRSDLLAVVQRAVPALRRQVAARRLDLHHARPEAQELAARERPRELAGEVDDGDAGERRHRARDYAPRVLAERTTDRRRELLEAAVRVFARKGFHAARVGDIAEEAGVAHGLLYHYFRSKEEVLETIFRETWELLDVDTRAHRGRRACRCASSCGGSRASTSARGSMTPDLVRVLVREVARSPDVGDRVGEIRGTLSLARAHHRGREGAGEVRADCDARFATWAVYGALEEILTGWVLGQLPAAEEDVERAAATSSTSPGQDWRHEPDPRTSRARARRDDEPPRGIASARAARPRRSARSSRGMGVYELAPGEATLAVPLRGRQRGVADRDRRRADAAHARRRARAAHRRRRVLPGRPEGRARGAQRLRRAGAVRHAVDPAAPYGDATVYPDSGKFAIGGSGDFWHRGYLGERVPYWEGEP